MSEHTYKKFDAELDEIRASIAKMGGLVEEQVRGALEAIETMDRELIDAIVARDAEVDEMEIAIDAACANIVARRQPAAIDLRIVLAVTKVVTDLERIGDEAKKIAKTSGAIMEHGLVLKSMQIYEVRHMGDLVARMLHDVMDNFVRLDAAAAKEIVRRDKEVDQMFRGVTRHLVTYMMEDPRTISAALDVIFIAKSVERIGDHAKNVARDVIYIAEGKDVRHPGSHEAGAEAAAE